jgi:hypothetical protein
MSSATDAHAQADAPRPVVSRSPTLRAFLLFVVIFGVLFAYEISVLFYQQAGVPSTARGDRPRLVGEIAGDAVLTQTFGVEAAGLSSITVELRPFGDHVSGDAIFTLTELPGSTSDGDAPASAQERVVAVVGRQARDVVTSDRFEIAFAPQEDSNGRHYRLRIEVPDAPAGQGLGAWATREQAYLGGVLTFAGKEQWGDLVFETRAERATLYRRVEHMLREAPGWIASPWLLGTLLVLYNWALATFTWYMLFVEDDAETSTAAG